jgi:hypothetical protein
MDVLKRFFFRFQLDLTPTSIANPMNVVFTSARFAMRKFFNLRPSTMQAQDGPPFMTSSARTRLSADLTHLEVSWIPCNNFTVLGHQQEFFNKINQFIIIIIILKVGDRRPLFHLFLITHVYIE